MSIFAVLGEVPGILSGHMCCMKVGACTPAELLSTADQEIPCYEVAVPVSSHPAGPPVAGCRESPGPWPTVPVHVRANASMPSRSRLMLAPSVTE